MLWQMLFEEGGRAGEEGEEGKNNGRRGNEDWTLGLMDCLGVGRGSAGRYRYEDTV
jgi:hypothetical protein